MDYQIGFNDEVWDFAPDIDIFKSSSKYQAVFKLAPKLDWRGLQTKLKEESIFIEYESIEENNIRSTLSVAINEFLNSLINLRSFLKSKREVKKQRLVLLDKPSIQLDSSEFYVKKILFESLKMPADFVELVRTNNNLTQTDHSLKAFFTSYLYHFYYNVQQKLEDNPINSQFYKFLFSILEIELNSITKVEEFLDNSDRLSSDIIKNFISFPENLEFSTISIREKVFELVQRIDFKRKMHITEEEKIKKSIWEILDTFFHNLNSLPTAMVLFMGALVQAAKIKFGSVLEAYKLLTSFLIGKWLFPQILFNIKIDELSEFKFLLETINYILDLQTTVANKIIEIFNSSVDKKIELKGDSSILANIRLKVSDFLKNVATENFELISDIFYKQWISYEPSNHDFVLFSLMEVWDICNFLKNEKNSYKIPEGMEGLTKTAIKILEVSSNEKIFHDKEKAYLQKNYFYLTSMDEGELKKDTFSKISESIRKPAIIKNSNQQKLHFLKNLTQHFLLNNGDVKLLEYIESEEGLNAQNDSIKIDEYLIYNEDLFKILKSELRAYGDNCLKIMEEVYNLLSNDYNRRLKEFLDHQKNFRMRMLKHQDIYQSFSTLNRTVQANLRNQQIKMTILNIVNSSIFSFTIKKFEKKNSSGSIFEVEYDREHVRNREFLMSCKELTKFLNEESRFPRPGEDNFGMNKLFRSFLNYIHNLLINESDFLKECLQIEIEEYLESYLTQKIFTYVFPEKLSDHDMHLQILKKKYCILRMEHFDIKPEFHLDSAWKLASQKLDRINLIQSTRDIMCEINELVCLIADIISMVSKGELDLCLQILIYLVIHSNVYYLNSLVNFLAAFADPRHNTQKEGCSYTLFLSSLIWLKNWDKNMDPALKSIIEKDNDQMIEQETLF